MIDNYTLIDEGELVSDNLGNKNSSKWKKFAF